MADAFVSIADDATAASWNPAGLVQLERPEISLVGAFNAISEAFRAPVNPEFETTNNDNNIDLNFLSFTYPFQRTLGDRNMTFSLSYQQKFDLSRSFDARLIRVETFGLMDENTRREDERIRFDQDGSLSTLTPAFAVEITRRLSIGIAVHLWRDTIFAENGWENLSRFDTEVSLNDGEPFSAVTERTERYDNFKGESFSFGVLWNATRHWNVGMRYDSKLKATTDYTRINVFNVGEPSEIITQRTERRKITLPSSFSFGASRRFGDRMTIAFDMTITDWENFFFENEDGDRFSLVDASNLNDPDEATEIDRTVTARLGAEYLFIPEVLGETMSHLWSLRGGLFLDQEPATGKRSGPDRGPGNGKPDNFYGFTIGAGLLVANRANIDIAYQLRYGPGVNSDIVPGVEGFDEDVVQHRILLSTVIYF